MKAISLHQPWASMIANGGKTIETRKWWTSYRGDLLICSTRKPVIEGLKCGYALCIVELYGCVPFIKRHEPRACCQVYPGAYAWLLRKIRTIEPFAVRGSQGFFEVNIPEINSPIVNRQSKIENNQPLSTALPHKEDGANGEMSRAAEPPSS